MANRITTVFEAQTRNFSQGVKGIKKSVNEAEGAVNKLKAGWSGAVDEFKNSRAAQTAVAAGAAAMAQQSIQAASALEESVNAVNVSYGNAAESVLALGDKSVESFGMSKRAFNQFSVRFSAFAKQIAGQTGRSVVDVLEEMTTRVADFASVHDQSLEESARVVMSTLAGETEVFRRFGGDVSAATVKTVAYRDGIAEVGSELTEGQKILARYAAFMEQTNNTQGDFANTSESLANQTRIATGNIEDLAAKMGTQLVPVVADLVFELNRVVDAAETVGGPTGLGGIPDVVKKTFDLREKIDPTFWLTRPIDMGVKKVVSIFRSSEAQEPARWAADMAQAVHGYELAITQALHVEERQAEAILKTSHAQQEAGRQVHDHTTAHRKNVTALQDGDRAARDFATRVALAGNALEESGDAAEDAAEDIDQYAGSLNRLKEALDLKDDVESAQDAFAEWRAAAIEAFNAAESGSEDAAAKMEAYKRKTDDMKSEFLELAEVLGLPHEATVEVLTLINQGELDKVERKLASLERIRIARVAVQEVSSGVSPSTYVPPPPTGSSIQRLDSGGVVEGRRGEARLVLAHGGETVLPTHKAGPGIRGVGGINVTVNAGLGADGSAIGQQVVNVLEEYYRDGGQPPRSS